jgi:hypothetical protein
MEHYTKILAVAIVSVLIVILVLLRSSSKKQKQKIAKMASLELWVKEKKKFDDTETKQDGILTTIGGELPGVSYTMNIDIEEWLHDKDIHFREIFTHGTGSFGFLEINDIVSIAIDAHKNDIIIDVNTKLFDPQNDNNIESCTAQAANNTVLPHNKLKFRKSQRLSLKYFPIAKYFHIAIVLTQNRVDAYIDGKLGVTKVFNGNVIEPNTQVTLPFKWLQGQPIKAYMSNFRYFNTELDVSTVKEIYEMDINPKYNTASQVNNSRTEDSDNEDSHNRPQSGCN